MSLTLEQAKEFLRIEHGEDDNYLSSLLSLSKKVVLNSTSEYADTEDELFIHAQRLLVAHYYENRNLTTSTQTKPLDFAYEYLLMQIKLTTSDPL